MQSSRTNRENPVKDLKVDEFKVYEDGKLQPIHTFALESYKVTQAQVPDDQQQRPKRTQARPNPA